MSLTTTGSIYPAQPAPPPLPGGARFRGDERAYWRLLVRGAALLMVTLGIYRFWLATDIRRFLWNNTEAVGDGLEYTGTAAELLFGFLAAIAILVPIYVGFFLAALGLGTMGQLAGLMSFPVLAVLGQFAIYRARRYRLTRTVFRGIRFQQSGSAWRYAAYAVSWWLAIAVTLGLAYPWAQASLERYKMRHTSYGDLAGGFDGSALALFWRGLLFWLLTVAPLAVCLGASIVVVNWDALLDALGQGEDFSNGMDGTGLAEALGLLTLAASWSGFAAALFYPAFQGLVLRWWTSGLRFGALRVRSHLRTRQVYRAYLRFLLFGTLFAVPVLIAAAVAFRLLDWIPNESVRGTASAVLGLTLYVTFALAYSTIYQATVKLALWRIAIESLDLDGVAALDRVHAAGTASSPLGEGLADALSVGGL